MDSFNEELRLKINRLFKNKGGTRIELAEYCGVSNPTVSRWLKGQQTISIHFIPKLAQYFGVSPEDLWNDAPLPNAFGNATPKQEPQPVTDNCSPIQYIRKISVFLNNNQVEIERNEFCPYAFTTDVIKRPYISSFNDLGVCTIDYSGLEPYLYAGDLVVIHLAESSHQDGRYMVITKQGIRVARLHYFLDGAVDVKEPVGETYHLTAQQASELILKTFRIILMVRLCD